MSEGDFFLLIISGPMKKIYNCTTVGSAKEKTSKRQLITTTGTSDSSDIESSPSSDNLDMDCMVSNPDGDAPCLSGMSSNLDDKLPFQEHGAMTLQTAATVTFGSSEDAYSSENFSDEEKESSMTNSDNEYSPADSDSSSWISDESDISDEPLDSGEDSSEGDDPSERKLSEQEIQGLCTLAFIHRHHLSGDASSDILKLVRIWNPDANFSAFENLAMLETKCTCFHYCSNCSAMFPEDLNIYVCSTPRCGTLRYKGQQTAANRQPKSYFVMANIESQLKQLLERKTVWQDVQNVKNKILAANNLVDSIQDITDGECYRLLCNDGQFLHSMTSISALFNTDGVPLYSSSNVSIWPLFLAINELPPSYRFARENLLLAGMWQGKGKPPFFQYMNAFGETMTKYYEDGINIVPYGCDEPICVKMGVIVGSVDLQAKAYITNMTMHNGEFGCITCEEPGKVVQQGRGHARCYPYRDQQHRATMRNSDDIKNIKAPRATSKKRIKGICGPSGLTSMSWFNFVHGMVPDYMHGILMGVTKTLLSLWFSSRNSAETFYIGKDIKTVSDRLQKIKPPDYIERLPRNLEKHYSNLKATELQSWLLFYGVPCLQGILPEEYLVHFCYLSEGTHLLLGDNILPHELERAESLFDMFYAKFAELYSEGSCGLNVHNTGAHMAYYVRCWGPLWAWSCFGFEDSNAAILQAVHGTGDIIKQYLLFKELQCLLNGISLHNLPQSEAKDFLKKMKQRRRGWTKLKKMENCAVAGGLQNFDDLDIQVQTCLRSMDLLQNEHLRKALRIEIEGQHYFGEHYYRTSKRISFVVCCQNGDLRRIKYFLVNLENKTVYAVAFKMKIEENCFSNVLAGKHIVKVKDTTEVSIFPVNLIAEKVVYMVVENSIFVSRMPNLLGHCIFK